MPIESEYLNSSYKDFFEKSLSESDPELFNIKIDAFDFKLYEYFCRNYDLKRLNPYVRMVDAADKFKVPLPKIKESLDRLSRITIDFTPLIMVGTIRPALFLTNFSFCPIGYLTAETTEDTEGNL